MPFSGRRAAYAAERCTRISKPADICRQKHTAKNILQENPVKCNTENGIVFHPSRDIFSFRAVEKECNPAQIMLY